MPSIQNKGFIIYIKFFLSKTSNRIWSDSDTDSDEKAGPSLSSAVEPSIKPLIFHHNQNHHYLWTTSSIIGHAIWGMYPHLAGDQSFLVFLGSNTSKFQEFQWFSGQLGGYSAPQGLEQGQVEKSFCPWGGASLFFITQEVVLLQQ